MDQAGGWPPCAERHLDQQGDERLVAMLFEELPPRRWLRARASRSYRRAPRSPLPIASRGAVTLTERRRQPADVQT